MAKRPGPAEEAWILKKAILIFVDGLGLGRPDPSVNPCAGDGLVFLNQHSGKRQPFALPLDGLGFGVDAALGVSGLPQSATGQTTLLTGVNCARLLGKHKPAFPNEPLRNILKEKSLLKQIRDLGLKPSFINAYRPLFFSLKEKTKWRLSATTVANLAADLPFNRITDIGEGGALYHDMTNRSLRSQGFDAPVFSPEKAAGILLQNTEHYHFILYEFFLTDRAGHTGEMDKALPVLEVLDRFIGSVLKGIDLRSTLVMITSDHGNVEDLSTVTHTRNPAMTLVWGSGKEDMVSRVSCLDHITPALIQWYRNSLNQRNSSYDTPSEDIAETG